MGNFKQVKEFASEIAEAIGVGPVTSISLNISPTELATVTFTKLLKPEHILAIREIMAKNADTNA